MTWKQIKILGIPAAWCLGMRLPAWKSSGGARGRGRGGRDQRSMLVEPLSGRRGPLQGRHNRGFLSNLYGSGRGICKNGPRILGRSDAKQVRLGAECGCYNGWGRIGRNSLEVLAALYARGSLH